MKLKRINEKIKQLKAFILNIAQSAIEPAVWKEFFDSENKAKGSYTIYENDLPIFRDLKAFLNILSAVGRITEKLSEHQSLIGAVVARRLEMVQDFIDFKRNYTIYMSTSNIMTRYLAYGKDVFIQIVLPQLKEKLIELSKLCTEENLEKIAEFFIEQVISLEQYQDNYKAYLLKQSLSPRAEMNEIDLPENKEDFIAIVIRNSNTLLKTIYKDKFDEYFLNKSQQDAKNNNKANNNKSDNTSNKKPEDLVDYYPENIKDTDIVKNIKLFLNGVIGVNKTLSDHASYEKAGTWEKIGWFGSLVFNLHKTYKSFKGFDYQAIIAEKSGPMTEEIKLQIKQWNLYLESLACVADQFEVELRLKEGSLLKLVQQFVDRYDDITNELRIQVDYVKQRNTYYHARLQARKNYLRDIDSQVNEIKRFLAYKDYALSDIPYYIIKEMKQYITKYHDHICMDKNHLAVYQEYLTRAQTEASDNWKAYIYNQFEYLLNLSGTTIHSEYMKTLNTRMLYLQKQKIYAVQRFDNNSNYYQNNPYCYIKKADLAEKGYKVAVLNVLKTRVQELNIERDKALILAQDKIIEEPPKPSPIREDSSILEKKTQADEKTINTRLSLEIIKQAENSKVALLEKNKPAEEGKPSLAVPLSDEKCKVVDDKNKLPDEKAKILKPKIEKPKLRNVNRAKLKSKEYTLFSLAVKKYEDTNNYQTLLDITKNEECLTAKTSLLIDEVAEVVRSQEQSTLQLT